MNDSTRALGVGYLQDLMSRPEVRAALPPEAVTEIVTYIRGLEEAAVGNAKSLDQIDRELIVERALADMRFARQTHLDWAEHVEDRTHRNVPCPQCEARGYPVDATYEREWVAKYDNVIALLEGLR